MPVILVIIIAMAWLAILGPGFVKRRWQAGEIGSVSHFHKQLRVLENSGPEPVDGRGVPIEASGPTAGPTPAPVLTVVGASQLPRPALAFLAEGPVEPRVSADRFRPNAPQDLRGPVDAVAVKDRMALADGRYRVRKRRRDTLGLLAAVFTVTLAIGFVPGAAVAWVVTALSAVALGAYLRPEGFASAEYGMAPAYGSPGSRVGSASMAGRYSHPSYQAVAH
jgi:hypothetical protein